MAYDFISYGVRNDQIMCDAKTIRAIEKKRETLQKYGAGEECYGYVVRDLNQCLSSEKTRHQTLDINPSTRILLILTTSQIKRVPHKVVLSPKQCGKNEMGGQSQGRLT